METETINLFFLRKGYYECVVTTKEEIDTPYDRKITVELESAKPWKWGTLVGGMGSCSAMAETVAEATDENYYFIDCRKWEYNDPIEIYLALKKQFADGGEYYTTDLKDYIGKSSCNLFLSPA